MYPSRARIPAAHARASPPASARGRPLEWSDAHPYETDSPLQELRPDFSSCWSLEDTQSLQAQHELHVQALSDAYSDEKQKLEARISELQLQADREPRAALRARRTNGLRRMLQRTMGLVHTVLKYDMLLAEKIVGDLPRDPWPRVVFGLGVGVLATDAPAAAARHADVRVPRQGRAPRLCGWPCNVRSPPPTTAITACSTVSYSVNYIVHGESSR